MNQTHTTRTIRRHWADTFAERLIQLHNGKTIVCASGISPSGVVHIGNFRELITTELVYRALQKRGVTARFLFFWDDYDALRSVPKGMKLEPYLRQPLSQIPADDSGVQSYAHAREAEVEKLLPVLGMNPDYIYQHRRYTGSEYAAEIELALNNSHLIREILNKYRTTPLPKNWWPVTVYSSSTNKDTTTIVEWDGKYLRYRCNETNKEERLDIRTTGQVKLQWRVDWPARWAKEQVDFEPAGKDHHSPGGSFDTAKEIVTQVYQGYAPLSPRYDFVGIKGLSGKMSSSSGSSIAIDQVLQVYQPQVLRYLFASTRPNVEFALSFDADVIKIYEDYDRCERIYFKQEEVGADRAQKEECIYLFSQIDAPPPAAPPQISFRHICTLVQVFSEIEEALASQELFRTATQGEKALLRVRAQCARYWVTHYAPPQYCFSLLPPRTTLPEAVHTHLGLHAALKSLYTQVTTLPMEASRIHNALYAVANQHNVEHRVLFSALYQLLIGKDQGPRLAHFFSLIGREEVLARLKVVK